MASRGLAAVASSCLTVHSLVSTSRPCTQQDRATIGHLRPPCPAISHFTAIPGCRERPWLPTAALGRLPIFVNEGALCRQLALIRNLLTTKAQRHQGLIWRGSTRGRNTQTPPRYILPLSVWSKMESFLLGALVSCRFKYLRIGTRLWVSPSTREKREASERPGDCMANGRATMHGLRDAAWDHQGAPRTTRHPGWDGVASRGDPMSRG